MTKEISRSVLPRSQVTDSLAPVDDGPGEGPATKATSGSVASMGTAKIDLPAATVAMSALAESMRPVKMDLGLSAASAATVAMSALAESMRPVKMDLGLSAASAATVAMSALAESMRPVKMYLGPMVSGPEVSPTPMWEVTEQSQSSLLVARLKPSRPYERIAFQCLLTAVLAGEAGNVWLRADAAWQQIIGLVTFMLLWVPGVQAQLDVWKLAGAIYDRIWGDDA